MQDIGLTINHLVYAFAAAVAAYVVRQVQRRRMAIRPRRPQLRMAEAWELAEWASFAGPDVRLVDGAVPAGRLQAEPITLEAERLSLASENPRLVIRQAILANATTALQLAAIGEYDEQARQALIRGYERGMDALLLEAVGACQFAWYVLRVYARWKFDDAIEDDWFHNYMHTARPYVREKVRLAKDHVMQMDAGAGRFAEIYDALLAELQQKMLKTLPKQRFVRPDLPA